MTENEHFKWLREHGLEHFIDKLPQVPREICIEHSNDAVGKCDAFCPHYKECRPVFEELAKALEVELSAR